MATIVNDLDQHLAERLKAERDARGWSTAELAERSGVSKAMIRKVERGESSPTAALLGRLAGAFGLTVSALFARAEVVSERISRARDQVAWRDPETGFERSTLSPAGGRTIEIVRGVLPQGAKVSYPASAYRFIDQQILMLDGVLRFTEGPVAHELRKGDCLELGPPADCIFENPGQRPCTYLVVVSRHR